MSVTLAELSQATIYQDKYLALDNIDFRIRKSDHIYVLGTTGSGKSTLLKALYAEVPLSNGKGNILGVQLHNNPDPDVVALLRRQIGIVSPNFPLLPHLNIGDNLLFVLEVTGWADADTRQQRVYHVLEQLRLTHIQHRLPTEITKTDVVRAQIARALLNAPALLLLDDPTAALDKQAQHDICTFVENLAQTTDLAFVWATNDTAIIPPNALCWRCAQGKLEPAK